MDFVIVQTDVTAERQETQSTTIRIEDRMERKDDDQIIGGGVESHGCAVGGSAPDDHAADPPI